MRISTSIARKLVFQAVAISFVTMIISMVFTYDSAKDIIINSTTNQLISEATIRGTSIENILDSRATHSHILANTPEIQKLVMQYTHDVSKDYDKEFLSQINHFEKTVKNSDVTNVVLSDKAGQVIFSLERHNYIPDISNDMYFKMAINGSSVAEFGMSNHTNEYGSVYSASPIYDSDGNIVGVVIITSSTASTDEILLNRSGLGNTGEVYLVNDRYTMISESRFIQHVMYLQKVDTLAVQNCIDSKIDTVGLYPDYRGIMIFGVSYCTEKFVLLAEIDEDGILLPIIQLENQLIVVGIVITVLMGVIAFFTSRKISTPLIKLRDAAIKITAGNLDVSTKIDSDDEIGQLSTAFDSMTTRIREQIRTIKQKEDTIRYEEEILLKFSKETETDCVCFVDIINSTKIAQKLTDEQISTLYETFLNEIAEIVKRHEGTIIKNIGDALLFSFVISQKSKISLSNAIDCCLAICDSHDGIADKLEGMGLPKLDYRISVSFGLVRVATSSTSTVRDIFGSTVNRCCKINHMAKPNGVISDEPLYKIVQSLEKYNFEPVPDGMAKYGYKVYHLSKSDNIN